MFYIANIYNPTFSTEIYAIFPINNYVSLRNIDQRKVFGCKIYCPLYSALELSPVYTVPFS
jgi:hypothetical protein